MFIDHFAATVLVAYLVNNRFHRDAYWYTLYHMYTPLRLIGRLGFPIFCFLLVEGFEHTRNKKKYALRLLAFALISEIPFDLAFQGKVLEFTYQNVYFTLFLGLLALCFIRYFETHRQSNMLSTCFTVTALLAPPVFFAWFIYDNLDAPEFLLAHFPDSPMAIMLIYGCAGLAIMLAVLLTLWKTRPPESFASICAGITGTTICMLFAALLKTDYTSIGVLTIVIMYLLRYNKVLSMAGGCGVLLTIALNEGTAFATLIPVALYNGKRGLNLKYVFYLFYPVHLLVLGLISMFLM